MNHPLPLQLSSQDREFLVLVAAKVLGKTAVAATTADALRRLGFDAGRVSELLPNHAVQVESYVLKKVEADIETPGNFGLFVRRRG